MSAKPNAKFENGPYLSYFLAFTRALIAAWRFIFGRRKPMSLTQHFHRLPVSIDRDLELVAPSPIYIEDMLTAAAHPMCWGESVATWTRQTLLTFVEQRPSGIEPGDPLLGRWPGYVFWMKLRPEYSPPVPIAGTISLRLSDDDQFRLYTGHVGYGVFPPARGYHYAERATRLLLALAKLHGRDHLWITCNPANLASRRTIERLGANLVEIIEVPENNVVRARGGETHKCRYRVDL